MKFSSFALATITSVVVYAANSSSSIKKSFPCSVYSCRLMATLSLGKKVAAPPMVYIAGEEMTRYTCDLVVEHWIDPYFDTSSWERFDLSCKVRDETNDQVLHDAVAAGARVGAIFKEPTITPSAKQVSVCYKCFQYCYLVDDSTVGLMLRCSLLI